MHKSSADSPRHVRTSKASRILGSYAVVWHNQGAPVYGWKQKNTFFLANEYSRAMGIPGLADNGKLGAVYGSVIELAERYMDTAAGRLDVKGLAEAIQDSGHNQN
ncbi:hypothetical protein ABKN59_004042 [Abortiporus biennis]